MGMSPKLLRPRASGSFTPKSISGLSAWWDASDTTTITLNSTTVAEWRDKSGNSRHMAQATAANQPSYVSSEFGTQAAVRVAALATNRINSSSNMSTLGNDTSQQITLFVVLKGLSATTNAKNIGEVDNPTGFGWYCRFTDGNSYFDAGSSATARVQSAFSQSAYTSGCVLTGMRSGGQVDQWLNGTLLSGSRSNATGSLQTDPGHNFSLRGGSAAVSFGEIIIYNRSLASSDRQSVERYLSKKYGIAVA